MRYFATTCVLPIGFLVGSIARSAETQGLDAMREEDIVAEGHWGSSDSTRLVAPQKWQGSLRISGGMLNQIPSCESDK
jgi:hypothetical protein